MLESPYLDLRQNAFLWLINHQVNTPEMKKVGLELLKSDPENIYGYIIEYLWKNSPIETEKIFFSWIEQSDVQAIYKYWYFANQTQNSDMFAKLKPVLLQLKPNQNFLSLLKESRFETQSIVDYYWQNALDEKNQEMLSTLLFHWKEKRGSLPASWIQALSNYEGAADLIRPFLEHPEIHTSQPLFQSCLRQAQEEVRQGKYLPSLRLLMVWPNLSDSEKLNILKQMPVPTNTSLAEKEILDWRIKLKDPSLKSTIKDRILKGLASLEEIESCADDLLLMDEAFFIKLKQGQLKSIGFLNEHIGLRDTHANRLRLLETLPKMAEADLQAVIWILEKWGEVRSLPALKARFQLGTRNLKARLLVLRAQLGDPDLLADLFKAVQSPDLLLRSAGLETMKYLTLSEQDLHPIEKILKQLEFDSVETRDLLFYAAPAYLQLEESLKAFKQSDSAYGKQNWMHLLLSQSKGAEDTRMIHGLISRDALQENAYRLAYGNVGGYDNFKLSAEQPLVQAALMRGPRGLLSDLNQNDPLIRLQAAILSNHLLDPQQLPRLKTLSAQTEGQLKDLLNSARYLQGDMSVKDDLQKYLLQNHNSYLGRFLVAHSPPEQRLNTAKEIIAQIPNDYFQIQILSDTGLTKAEQARIPLSEKEEDISPEQIESLQILKKQLMNTSQNLTNLIGDSQEFAHVSQDVKSLNALVWQIFFETELKLRKSLYSLDITTLARQERLEKKLKEFHYDPRQADFEIKLKGQSLLVTATFRKHQFKLLQTIWGEKTALDWLKKLDLSDLGMLPSFQFWLQTQLLPDARSPDYFSHLAQINTTLARFGYKDKQNHPFARVALAHLKAAAYYHKKNTAKVEQALVEMAVEFKRLPSDSLFGMSYARWFAIYHKWQGLMAEQKGNLPQAEEEWLWSLWWVGYVYHQNPGYSWESWPLFLQPQHTRLQLRSHKGLPSQHREWYENYFGRDFSLVDRSLKPLLLSDK